MVNLVSVILPVYNGRKYLKVAIESILKQTFKNFEFIIIDDGSNDDSVDIINMFLDKRIKFIKQNNKGLPRTLNIGIENSTGKYIARMDQDDISHHERLERQYEFIENNPECVAIGSNAEVIDMYGNYVYTSRLPLSWDEIKCYLPATPFFHPSTMFRKSAFDKVGGYPEVDLIEDVLFFNRLAKVGEFRNIQDALLKYRIVPNSCSLRSNKNNRVHDILDKAIDSNKISDNDCNYLKLLLKNRNSKDDVFNYYLLLAKKYLWNNYQPKLARKNLSKSFQLNPSLYVLTLFLVSFLPSKLILQTYRIMKSF